MPRTAEEIQAEIDALEDELDELVPDEPKTTPPPASPEPTASHESEFTELETAIAEAEEAGDFGTAGRLKVQLAKKLGTARPTDEDAGEIADLTQKIEEAMARNDYGANTRAWKHRLNALQQKGNLSPDGVPATRVPAEESSSDELRELQAAITQAEAEGDFKKSMHLKVELTRKVFGR